MGVCVTLFNAIIIMEIVGVFLVVIVVAECKFITFITARMLCLLTARLRASRLASFLNQKPSNVMGFTKQAEVINGSLILITQG